MDIAAASEPGGTIFPALEFSGGFPVICTLPLAKQ
jgi:hypothetical protein